MFLLVKATWVQHVCRAKQGKLPSGQPLLPGLSKRVRKKLDNRGLKLDKRLANREELIDEALYDDKEEANDPGPYRAGGCRWVVLVADDGANFGVG